MKHSKRHHVENTNQSIQLLQKNAEEFNRLFISLPFKKALKNRHYKSTLILTAILICIITPYIIYEFSSHTQSIQKLIIQILPITLIMLICGIHNVNIIIKIRIEEIRKKPALENIKPGELQLAMKTWYLKELKLKQDLLIFEAKKQLELWNFWRMISKEVSAEEKSFALVAKFMFHPPEPARFMTLLTALLALITTLVIAAGITPDSVFDVLTDYKGLLKLTILVGILAIELVLAFSMIAPIISKIWKWTISLISPNSSIEDKFKEYIKQMIWSAGVEDDALRPLPRPVIFLEKIADAFFVPWRRGLHDLLFILVEINFLFTLIIGIITFCLLS